MPSSTEERLFSSDPRCFKMDRNSPDATNLRAAVANKLFEFLGTYSDNVLAEYIVVLVCNGKHQNQARDDLEAFLGEGSGKFVAWLWHHISEEILISRLPLDPSRPDTPISHDDNMTSEHKTCRPADIEMSSAVVSHVPLSVKYEETKLSTVLTKTIDEPESPQRWCPDIDSASIEMDIVRPAKQTLAIDKLSGSPDYSCGGVTKCPSSSVRCSPENSSGRGQYLPYENQVLKIARSNHIDATCRPLPVPKTKPVARNLRSIITDDLQTKSLSITNAVSGRLPSSVMDAVPHQTTRPRGNVWDRLGKPCNKDDASLRQNQYQPELEFLEREKMDHNGEGIRKLKSVQVVHDSSLSSRLVGEPDAFDNCGRAISDNHAFDNFGRIVLDNHSDEHRIHDHNFHIVGSSDHVDNSKRKKLSGDFCSGDSSASFSGQKENNNQYKEAHSKFQESLPIKSNHSRTLNEITSEAKNAPSLIPKTTHVSVKSVRTKPNLDAHKVTQPQMNWRAAMTSQLQKLVPDATPKPAKLETVVDAEHGKANHTPTQDEVLIVKSRLRQVEMDMLKLRSKQTEIVIDPKPNSSSGSQHHSEEDIESRTVLVTNVHFAAPKEALLSHFMLCGVVHKVILLTDTVTAQPKGAAYIVFASKESVDKALSMSGTSFFSRILTVMRKADMPPGFLVPAQLAVKPLQQQQQPQPYTKGLLQRQYSSSHLQWKRDQSTTTTGLGSSNAAA